MRYLLEFFFHKNKEHFKLKAVYFVTDKPTQSSRKHRHLFTKLKTIVLKSVIFVYTTLK